MAFDPQKDARNRAIAAGAILAGVAFEGLVLPVGAGVPDAAVFFRELDGFPPSPHHDAGDFRRAIVSVVVRGPALDPDAARVTAAAVYASLHEAGAFASADAASAYVDSLAMRNSFSRLADDETGHPLYSCDFILQYIG